MKTIQINKVTIYALVVVMTSSFIQTSDLNAQDTSKRRTIDITSSFKPSLKTQQKIGFTASAATGDSSRPALNYQLPSQNLAFSFSPAPLRPLAFQQDSMALHPSPSFYLKAGYGNFSTPYVKALASFGNGIKSNGSVEANYIGSKGTLPYQQYQQYGARGNLWLHMKNNNSLRLYGGFQGLGTYRYGWEPKDRPVPEDSLKVRYSVAEVGAALGNPIAGPGGISYNAKINFHYFTDNAEGQETAFKFELPISKEISDNITLNLGIKGMVSSFSGSSSSFSNNLFLIPVNARFQLQENLSIKAGIIPSWNNKEFKLLPDVELEYLLNDRNMVVQAGFKGYFEEQTYRSLVAFNPWIAQPASLTNTRNSEFFAALKSSVTENISYRIKAGFGKQYYLPLFVNDNIDGRYFELVTEPDINRAFIAGELLYQKGDKLNWSTSLQLNSYGGIDVAPKAYGLLPFELRSSLQLLLRKNLRFKTDLYTFGGAPYNNLEGDDKKGPSVLDLNAGLEFDVHPKVKLWLQFNNIINQDYQRWNQYRVLGFQALGGVIFHL